MQRDYSSLKDAFVYFPPTSKKIWIKHPLHKFCSLNLITFRFSENALEFCLFLFFCSKMSDYDRLLTKITWKWKKTKYKPKKSVGSDPKQIEKTYQKLGLHRLLGKSWNMAMIVATVGTPPKNLGQKTARISKSWEK